MKKIYIVLVLMFGLILVGCTPTNNELPPLNEADALDLTMEEKYELVQQINFDDVEDRGFRFDQFMKIDLIGESTESYESAMYSSTSENSSMFSVDYDASIYASLGANANESVFYAGINKAILNVTTESSSTTTMQGQDPMTESSKGEYSFNITDSFLLIMEKMGYIRTNGNMSVKSYEDGVLNEEDSKETSYADIKEKSMTTIFTDEMFLDFQQQITSMKAGLEVLPEDLPTDAELDELMEELDAMITVYQTDDVYTLRILVDKIMIDTLIDQTFDMIMLQLESPTTDQITSFNSLKSMVKSALKSFEFDFRIEVKGPEDGVKNLSKISLSVKGQFTGFTFDMAEFDEQAMPYRIDFGVTVEKFGFIIDFNGAEPEFPTQAELDAYTAVETPSILAFMAPEEPMIA